MQYWIYYYPGVGGDGFGCMLEHANNMFPADGLLEWRIHQYANGVENKPKRFYQAAWCKDPLPFRQPCLPHEISLNPVYLDLVNQNKNTVITSHYYYFNQIARFKYRSLVEKNQVKIHLYSNNSLRVYNDVVVKRGAQGSERDFIQAHQMCNYAELRRTEYAMHIDIERAWRDWAYLSTCLDQLEIILPKSIYEHYLSYIDLSTA